MNTICEFKDHISEDKAETKLWREADIGVLAQMARNEIIYMDTKSIMYP